jgi:2'-5' RNA ligase
MPDLILAPDYRQSDDEDTICGRCRFGGTGYCRLYQFPYLNNFTCASWQAGVQENVHNGVMVALMVPLEVGDLITADVPSPLPLGELHLTLGYLGNVSEQWYGPEYIRLLLTDFVSCWYEVKGAINGVGRFNRGDGDTEAFYASFDASYLAAFRHELCEFLARNGIAVYTEHGFTPHITLSYIPKDAANPIENLPPIEFTFKDLTLGWGDRLYSFPLLRYDVYEKVYLAPRLTYDYEDSYYNEMARSWTPGTVVRAAAPQLRATDFPNKGEDKAISLRNSQYPQFDRTFAERIKADYPDIWDAGGNIRGNEAFDLWGRAIDGDDAPVVLDWIKEREAWSARHYRDGMQFNDGESPTLSSIAGVVALMKWGTIGELGEGRMKEVVNEVAEKMMDDESRTLDLSQPEAAAPGVLARFGKAILRALGLGHMLREIKDVETWDGAASRWETTADYCDACLINLNSGDRADWVQNLCKLPVREPGDEPGTYVRQAVYAAAARINQITKPSEVSDEEWESRVIAAARELESAYDEMDEDAPEIVGELAERKRAVNKKRDTLETLQDALYEMSLNLGRICLLYAIQYDDAYDATFVIMVCEGVLWRAPYSIDEFDQVYIGEWEMVEPIMPAMSTRANISVSRSASGRYHYTLISATPFLNRVGEIDSTELFDSFIQHARSTGDYPRLDFFHFENALSFGQSYYLDRVGLAYIEMGWFDDTEIGRSFAQAIMREPDYWGNSIQYKPVADPLFEEVAPGIYALVYRAGIHKFTSLLPEMMAANLFTSAAAQGETNMLSEQELDALLRGLKDVSEEIRENVMSQVRSVNRAGQSGQYVFRSAVPAATEVKVELPDMQPLVDQIVEAVVGRVNDLIGTSNTALAEQVTSSLNDLAERVEAVETSTENLQTQVAPVVKEHKERAADAPAGRQGGNLFIPRFQRAAANGTDNPAKPAPLNQQAEATVTKIFGGKS